MNHVAFYAQNFIVIGYFIWFIVSTKQKSFFDWKFNRILLCLMDVYGMIIVAYGLLSISENTWIDTTLSFLATISWVWGMYLTFKQFHH